MQVGFLGPFIRQFLDAGYLFPLPLALHDALLQRFSSLRILVQVVIQFSSHKIIDEGAHGRTVRCHVQRSEFGLGLAFEHRFLHPYRHCRDNALADVGCVIIFLVKFPDGLYHCFAECSEVRAALGSELTIHEAVVFFAVVVVVRHGDLDILPFQVDDGIAQFFLVGLAFQEIEQTIL